MKHLFLCEGGFCKGYEHKRSSTQCMRWQGLAITHYEGDNLTSLKLTAKARENGWGLKTTSFLL